MKSVKLFVIFTLIAIKCFAINDIKKIEETVHSFIQPFFKDTLKISDEFLLSFDEFKMCYKLQNRKHDEQTILNEFQNYYQRNIADRSIYLKRELGNVNSIVSWDTLRYTEMQRQQNKFYFIDISIELSCTSRHISDTARTLFKFVILNGKLKLTGQFKTISNLHYQLHKLETIQAERQTEFYANYKYKYFRSGEYNCIPYKARNKWGLISLDNKQLIKPIYDSIYPFASGYALAVVKGKYNLIDTNFKSVFKQNKKHIKLTDEQYYVLNNKNEYEEFPPQPKDDNLDYAVMVEESVASITPSRAKKVYPQRDYSVRNLYKTDADGKTREFHIITNDATNDTLSVHEGFDYIGQNGNFIYGLKRDTMYVMRPNGEVLFKNSNICSYNDEHVDIIDDSTRLFGMYIPRTNTYIVPKYAFIKPIDEGKFFVVVTKKGTFGYLDPKGKELF